MIKVEKLTKRYGKHTAINNLNFKIDKGEIIGFLGPNGAGKSTTMNIITGYLSATSGRVLVDGMDVLERPEDVKKLIGYLPEAPPLYMDMTVNEYLCFVGELKKVSKEQLKQDMQKICDLVKIADVRKRLIKNLSKGYKQRVGLAQALLGDPQLLILDEPTIGLDPKQIIEIRNLIKALGEHHTVVLSSHILPEVSAICERVMIVNKGVIVASDTPKNLSKALAGTNRLSLRIGGTQAEVEKCVKLVKGIKHSDINSSPEINTVELRIEAERDLDIRREIFFAFSKSKLPILLMRPDDLTLEEIFLHLTTSEKEVS